MFCAWCGATEDRYNSLSRATMRQNRFLPGIPHPQGTLRSGGTSPPGAEKQQHKSGSSTTSWRKRATGANQVGLVVPHDLTLEHVDEILGNVGGVIADPFEFPRDAEQQQQRLR